MEDITLEGIDAGCLEQADVKVRIKSIIDAIDTSLLPTKGTVSRE